MTTRGAVMEVLALGPVGTLLLGLVPELREPVGALLLGETLARLGPSGAIPEPAQRVSGPAVTAEFREAVLRPALAGLPDSRDLVDRCGRALLSLGETEADLVRRTLDRLTPGELAALVAACPALAPVPGQASTVDVAAPAIATTAVPRGPHDTRPRRGRRTDDPGVAGELPA